MVTRSNPNRWRDRMPPDSAWKCRPGLDRAKRTAEQDRAAGGNHNRLVGLADGRIAHASVVLKVLPRTRRIRAYVRWYDRGRTVTRYVGEVDATTRRGNLEKAWQSIIAMGLLPTPTATTGSWASTPAVRAVMRGNRSRNTEPELALRKHLWARGLRYRVDARPLPQLRRRADVVFVGPRVAVFVDGCYWHGCPDHHRPSRKNAEFWEAKIAGNRERDAETDARLVEAGWTVLRIWEHEDPAAAAIRVEDAVLQHRQNPSAEPGVRAATSAVPLSS